MSIKVSAPTTGVVKSYFTEKERNAVSRFIPKSTAVGLIEEYVGNLHFCPLPLGIPDPRQPLDLVTKIPRDRIFIPPQEGHTCWKFATDRIRLHIGEKPEGDFQIALRKVEDIVLQTCKREIDLHSQSYWKQDFAAQLGSNITRKKAQKVLDRKEMIDARYREKCCAFLQAFCNQDQFDDLLIFAFETYQHELIKIKNALLVQFDVNPATFFTTKLQKVVDGKLDASTRTLSWVHDSCFFDTVVEKFGLKRSSWHPSQPIEKLIEELLIHGNLLVKGEIGQEFYEDKPFKLQDKVEGRSVYGWKPSAKRKSNDFMHVVIIIGARNDKGHIYFIDPIDGSDPKDIEQEKVYVMSYDRFRSVISDLFGIRRALTDGSVVFAEENEGENNYALYGNPEINFL